jgi:hypothetical protein
MQQIDLPPGDYRGGREEPRRDWIGPAVMLIASLVCLAIPFIQAPAFVAGGWTFLLFIGGPSAVAGWSLRTLLKPRPVHIKQVVQHVVEDRRGNRFEPDNPLVLWLGLAVVVAMIATLVWNRGQFDTPDTVLYSGLFLGFLLGGVVYMLLKVYDVN